MKGSAAKKHAPAEDIDDYLAALPQEKQIALEILRKATRGAAPVSPSL
ncbi:MAG: hypothetical protein JW854_06515 [Actinobacteria bacterium]|nr:hypothetical protein [Actinomycetota bacterium]